MAIRRSRHFPKYMPGMSQRLVPYLSYPLGPFEGLTDCENLAGPSSRSNFGIHGLDVLIPGHSILEIVKR